MELLLAFKVVRLGACTPEGNIHRKRSLLMGRNVGGLQAWKSCPLRLGGRLKAGICDTEPAESCVEGRLVRVIKS